MDKRQKWISEIANFIAGRVAQCPVCGGHNFKDGYIELDKEKHIGWGAVWCEKCLHAFVISRIILRGENIHKKIIPHLPNGLKFV